MAGWEVWLSSSLADLTQRNLVRTLRPTIPSSSAAEVTAGGSAASDRRSGSWLVSL